MVNTSDPCVEATRFLGAALSVGPRRVGVAPFGIGCPAAAQAVRLRKSHV
jgi:hypothetical protein